MTDAQASEGHGWAARPRLLALIVALAVPALLFAVLFVTSTFDGGSDPLWILALVVAFGVPLVTGAVLTIRQRSRRTGLVVLAGVGLGIGLTFMLVLWLVGEMASNIGS